MALDIQFVDRTKNPPTLVNRFQLREAAEGGWLLPNVILMPVDSLPHISRLTVTVAGSPTVVAQRIQAAFFNREFKPLHQVGQRLGCGGGRIADAGPLPSEASCELTVIVHYFDSDGKGKPAGAEQVAQKICKLFTTEKPNEPQLFVRPPELAVIVDETALLLFDVLHAQDETPPAVRLEHPETVLAPADPLLNRLAPLLPELREGLRSCLSVTAQGRAEQGHRLSFSLNFTVRLSQPCKNLLSTLNEPLLIPLRSELPRARAVQHLLKLESAQNPFPGWLVIDFGTTNSTVTVRDPRDQPPIEGLPEEQEDKLREEVGGWLRLPVAQALRPRGRQFEAEWQRLLTMVSQMLGLSGPDALQTCFSAGQGPRLYEVLAQVELAVRPMPAEFRRAVYRRLHEFYHRALRVPALQRFNLYPVHLDLTRQVTSIASEIEIRAIKPFGKDDQFLLIGMGNQVEQERRTAIATAGPGNLAQVLGRFHPSPKRYFGTDHPPFTVEVGGHRYEVTVDQMMRAGWNELIQLTEKARQHDRRFGPGPFRRVVITYPTIAPPSVRQNIRKLLRDLSISEVRTDYDEAVAAAIFYLMREYGGATDLGLESFKSRCRSRSDGAWVQNVMVFDVGGGTTDVALIRLTLEEETVFAPGEDRGAGGRYYRIRPQLLSSTGHMQLGGELMTLRLYRLLKAMLADRLLTLTQEGKLRAEVLKSVLTSGLPESFTDSKGRYRAGLLRQILDQEAPERDAAKFKDALELAERVVPTRTVEETENRCQRFQTFSVLWEMAEELKKQLGGRSLDENTVRPPQVLDLKKVREIVELVLADTPLALPDASRDLRLEVSLEQFERVIEKVIDDAVKIARGAMEHLPEGDMVDWLILSGQSCNLALVDRKIQTAFRDSNRFVWNRERITFEPLYAKLATSIGAGSAEIYRLQKFAPKEAKPVLRRGINTIYFDINNLFSSLPCSFNLQVPGGKRRLFRSGDQLFELDRQTREENRRAKARSGWGPSQLLMEVRRQDYTDGGQTFWGEFAGQDLVNRLGLNENDWLARIRVEFEVDHRLDMDVLACRFEAGQDQPHYCLSGSEPRLDLRLVLQRIQAARTSLPPAKAAPAAGRTPELNLPPLCNDKGELQWLIGTLHSATNARTVLFDPARQRALAMRFRQPGKEPLVKRGLLDHNPVEHFPESGRLDIWGCPVGSDTWVRLGELQKPEDQPLFRRRYRLSLDEDGALRIHEGEPAYWESTNPQVLRDTPGCVYRTRLAQRPRDTDEERNPFSGRH